MKAVLAVVALAFAAAGCSSSGSGGDPRSELEGIIRSQLPDKVKQGGGPAVFVQSVQCTKAGGNKYDCVATVRGSDGQGKLVSEDVSITGTCDQDSCVWRSESAF